MNSVTLTDLNNKKLLCPGSFNELSRTQLLTIIELLYATGDETRKRFRMLRELFNYGRSTKTSWILRWKMSPEAYVEMFPLTDFIFKESDLTKNLLPSVRVPFSFKKLSGPDDRLNNIVFIEFIKCERFYNKFQKTREVKHLDKLIAVLYRAKKKSYDPLKDGDIREKYIDENKFIDHQAKLISRLPIRVRLSILHYYHGCRNYIFNYPAYKQVFKKVEKIVDVNQRANIKEDYSWEKALMNMAATVKDTEDIAQTRLTTVLYYLNEKIENYHKATQPIKETTL
jgi:hypothetical protein